MAAYNFLIIDDDADDHEFISAAIKKIHPEANIKSFFDGLHISTHWFKDSEMPNVIFLDLNMTIVDGKTALKNIRSDNHLKDIPVIILTTDKGTYTKSIYLDLGANGFYSKPYEFQQMINIISEVTDKWLRLQQTA